MNYFITIIIVCVVAYIMFKFKGNFSSNSKNHYELDPDEEVKYMWSGEFDTEISTAEKIGTAVLGIAFGGIATVRPLGVSMVITTKNRLVLCIEYEENKTKLWHFSPKDGLKITILGDSSHKIQGGKSKSILITNPQGESIKVLMHESAEEHLNNWLSS